MLGISEAVLAGVTGISSTLTRRNRSGQLTPEESEHVLRAAPRLRPNAPRACGRA